MRYIYLILFFILSNSLLAQPLPLTPWKERGPISFPIDISGQINGIGRTSQVKFHKTDTSIMYAVSASGGVYKSTNGGNLWTNLTGSIYLPKGAQVSICVDYGNDNNLYLGTGDANYYSGGFGVWKSTDGGQNFYQKNTGMGNQLVIEILQDPTDRAKLIAATNNGIFKSTDSANNWTLKTASGIKFTDMEYKPGSNGRVIYAVTIDSGYYRSNDYGETWTNLMNTGGLFMPAGGASLGMRVSVCAADTNIVYIGMVKNYGTIFKSNNGGTNFSVMKNNAAPNLVGYQNNPGDGGQGNYNFDINCSPSDPSILYLVSHNVWKSVDSGITWAQMTNWWATVHTDMHQVAISPHITNKVYDVNDGGIWLTRNEAVNWVQKSDGLSANEISPMASSNLDYDCISIGTQDNGQLFRNDTNIWKTNNGGDFYSNMNYDYINPRMVYYTKNIKKLVTGGEFSLNFPTTSSASWIELNPLAKTSCLITVNDSIWLSQNIQDLTPTWTLAGTFNGNQIRGIAWSKNDTNKLFVITKNSRVYRTVNLFAATPNYVFSATPTTTNTAAAITIASKSDSVVYISCGNNMYRSGNLATTWANVKLNFPNINIIQLYNDPFTINESVYVISSLMIGFKTDTMTSWQNITQNLPSVPSLSMSSAYNDGTPRSELRIAFYGKGVWSIPIETRKIPNAEFGSDKKKLCSEGKSIQYLDSSSNNPTSWSWSFPGGTPSTSTLQNPIITYNTAGIYPATLTATNAVGSNTKTKTYYITVLKGDTLPVSENFESGLLPKNWTIYDDGNDYKKWRIYDTASGSFTGTKSFRFDNTTHSSTSKKDAIQSTIYNLKDYDSVWMSFDRAFSHSHYSTSYNDSKDTMQVAVDNTCGQGALNSVWLKGHTALATIPTKQANGASFVPLANQWKKDTINLTAYAGQKEVSIIFRINNSYSSGFGQILYLDNINIWGKLRLYRDTIIFDTICQGIIYNLNSKSFTSSGTYRDTLRKIVTGEDSLRITLNLLVKAKSFDSISKNICTGDSFLFNGIYQKTTGNYLDTLINKKGCDSILKLKLVVGSSTSKNIFDTICANQFKLFNGINQNTTGIYLDTLTNGSGCDSILSLNLFVKSISNQTIFDTICSNRSRLFNGFNRTNTGIYLDTLQNSQGCDSFLALNLFVKSTSTKNRFDTICQGDSVLFKSIWRKTNGLFKDTLVNTKGCDSFINLYLTVKPKTFSTISETRCFNNPYFFNNASLSTSGTYFDTLVNAKGCDSIIQLNLTIIPSLITPNFDTILNLCIGNTPPSLNTTSPNGVSGMWSPATINNQVSAAYNFTPNSSQCASSSNLKVNILPLPTISFSALANYTICFGDAVNISAKGGVKYLWDNAKTTASIIEYPQVSKRYSVKVTDANLCSKTDSIKIHVIKLEVVISGPTTKISKRDEVVLTANSNLPISRYTWLPASIFTNQSIAKVKLYPEHTVRIELNAKDSFGCTAISYYYLELLGKDVLVPSGFSPNSDGINDLFRPTFKSNVKILRFTVFNRLGELIYNYEPQTNLGWNGTYNGENCPSATYVYQLEYSLDSKLVKVSGEVTLMR
jgi:gliding motility-associated-like protein